MSDPQYLDMAATSPVSERVAQVVQRYMVDDFGNAGSRTHKWGSDAKKAVNNSRNRIAEEFGCRSEEVVFTSGATESNNLAILGLMEFGLSSGRKHIVSSVTEHKAVLEPLKRMERFGFEIDLISPDRGGRIEAGHVDSIVRDDTLLVSLMHVNNETGVINDIEGVQSLLKGRGTFLHVDAAQSFLKTQREVLRLPIDMVSISGHKIGAPKGIGALVTRRRGWEKLPLEPLIVGGGQERGLRAGTLPVELIAGFAEAVSEKSNDFEKLQQISIQKSKDTASFMAKFGAIRIGDSEHIAMNIANFFVPGRDAEALILELQPDIAIATGSACTSAEYTASHVLLGMGFSEEEAFHCVRLSW